MHLEGKATDGHTMAAAHNEITRNTEGFTGQARNDLLKQSIGFWENCPRSADDN
jgi:hypothetical protein